jgi:flavin reductase (DIM6/NTAB) family NADH-FMN oxidoreductase RutF
MRDSKLAHLDKAEGPLLEPEDEEVGLAPEFFKAVFRNHAAGVAVITADAGDGPVAMTATSVFSVSATPPILVFSASELSSSTSTIRRASTVVVHLLNGSQLPLAILCATSGVDRFADESIWARLPNGEPYFTQVTSWVRGRVTNQLQAGASTLFVVHALEAFTPENLEHHESAPLVYHNRAWHSLSGRSQIR